MGLTPAAEQMLELVRKMDCFKIAAVADLDSLRSEAFARQYECAAFSDFRRFLIQTPLDVLIVGEPLYSSADYIRQAIQKKCHIIKIPPPALNFEQCATFIQQARKEEVFFVLSIPGRFEPAILKLREALRQDEPDYWHLITAVSHVPMDQIPPQMRWLYDPQTAGGGVLLQNTYDLLDEVVLCFGLPQQVYAQLTSQAPDRQQRLSVTEDTALVLMRFSDTLMAQVCASRTLGPARRHLRIHGKGKFITVTGQEFTLHDNQGNLLEQVQFKTEQIHGMQDFLTHFSRAVLKPAQHKMYPPLGMDLYTMATLEAIYLSARTAMPETPLRLLDLAGAGTTMW